MHTLAEEAAGLIRQARHAIAFTGAGISVPSGIPDFRSPGGLWSKYDSQAVASLTALRTNPKAVWEFLLDAVSLFGTADPNPAHLALAELEQAGLLKAVITQNIDGLHRAAGSKNVVEFHGGCERFYCMGCKRDYDPAEAKKLTADTIPWRCGDCGGVIRPDVVFFGEGIPPQAMIRTHQELEAADLVIIVGTSGEVAPANQIPYQVKSRGGKIIEINLGPTAFAQLTDLRFDSPAEETLPGITNLATHGGRLG